MLKQKREDLYMSDDMILRLNYEVFDDYRDAFNKMLYKTISDMNEKNSQDGKLTSEIVININNIDEIDEITGEIKTRKVPSFEFKIGSAINIKSKMDFKQNYFDSELILTEYGEYAIRNRKDQTSLFDEDQTD